MSFLNPAVALGCGSKVQFCRHNTNIARHKLTNRTTVLGPKCVCWTEMLNPAPQTDAPSNGSTRTPFPCDRSLSALWFPANSNLHLLSRQSSRRRVSDKRELHLPLCYLKGRQEPRLTVTHPRKGSKQGPDRPKKHVKTTRKSASGNSGTLLLATLPPLRTRVFVNARARGPVFWDTCE